MLSQKNRADRYGNDLSKVNQFSKFIKGVASSQTIGFPEQRYVLSII